MEASAGIDPAEPVQDAIGKIAQLLDGSPDGPDATLRIAGTIGLSEPTEIADSVWAFRLLFEVVARRRPVLVVIEDLHWAEPGLLEMLLELVAGGAAEPIAVLAGSRPEAREIAPALSGLPAVHLGPLGEPEVDRLLEDLMRECGLAEMPPRVKASAGGNPLLPLPIRSPTPRRRDRHPTHRTLDHRRPALSEVAWLSVEERRLFERAAVIGTAFWPSALRQLAADVDDAIDPLLDRLASRQLIAPGTSPRLVGEDPYLFSHPLIREVTYENTLKETRSEAHLGFAQWLERAVGERIGEWEEIVVTTTHARTTTWSSSECPVSVWRWRGRAPGADSRPPGPGHSSARTWPRLPGCSNGRWG